MARRKSQERRVTEALAGLQLAANSFEAAVKQMHLNYTYWNDSRNRNDLALAGFSDRLDQLSSRQKSIEKIVLDAVREDAAAEKAATRRKKK